MPCFYTGSAEGDARLAASEAREALTSITQLLCETCRQADKNHYTLPAETQKWWNEHKTLDRKNGRK